MYHNLYNDRYSSTATISDFVFAYAYVTEYVPGRNDKPGCC